MSKILVTGGAGFIGSNLVDRLIADSHQVTVLDNLVSGKKDYINPQANFWQMDILDDSLIDRFKEQDFDLVYHLAAQIDVRKSVEDPIFDNRVNVLGSLNILEACRLIGLKKIIFASTGGAIYGETDEVPTSEHAPVYPLSPYGINKLIVEKYLNYYYQVFNLNYTVLRLANVYGPRQYKGAEAGVVAIFTEAAALDKECVLYGDGLQTRDFIYVDDVVEAMIKAAKIDCRGEMNVSTGQEISLQEVISTIEDVSNKKLKLKKEEARLGEQRRSALLNRRALEVLNWQPKTSFREGVSRAYHWSKEKVK